MSRLVLFSAIIILLLSFPFFSHAQVTLEGRIFDQVNHEPIKGAQVIGGKKQTKTHGNGRFKLEMFQITDSLMVKAEGYLTKRLALPNDQEMVKELRIGLISLGQRTFNEVVIAGYPEGQSAKRVPGNITVIDEETIDAESDHTLARVLDQTPGLHYQQGALSTGRMTIRGIGARSQYATSKIKAYYKNIPITSGEGISNLMDFAPDAIGRAEIIKGPISSVYGAGLGGTVLLEPQQGTNRGTQLKIGGKAGSFGYWNSSATLSHVTNDERLFVNYDRTQMEGFRENSEFNRHNATVTGSFYMGENSTLNLFGSYIYMKSYIPSSLSRETFENSPDQADEGWDQANGHEEYDKTIFGASYETKIVENLESTTAIFTHYKNNDEPRPFDLLREQRFSYGARHLTTYSSKIFNAQTSWTLGGEIVNEWYQRQTFENLNRQVGSPLSNTEQDRFYYNIFLRGEIQLTEKLKFSAGVNYNQTHYQLKDLLIPDSVSPGTDAYQDADESGKYDFDPILSPRMGVNYELNDEINVFASVSSGFSQPTVQETLDPAGALNPDIQPERGTSYEVGSRGKIKGTGVNYVLSIYHMQVKDKLVARRVDRDTYIGLNAGSTTHNGLEVSLEGRDWIEREKGWLSDINPFIQYSFQDFEFEEFVVENEDGKIDHSGNDYTGTAPHHLTAGLKTQIWGSPALQDQNTLKMRLTYRYRDQMPVLDDNSIYTDPYHIFNVRLSYKHHFQGVTLEAFAAVRNFTDNRYAAMIVPNIPGYGGSPRYYYPGEPRTFRVGLNVNFGL